MGNILAINALARVTLIKEYGNILDLFLGLRGSDFLEAFGRWFTKEGTDSVKNGSFTKVGYPYELENRGFGDKPGLKNLDQYYF